MDLKEAIGAAIKEVPKAVAAGVVDMDSGMLLDIKTTSSHPNEVFDLLAAATKDMYEGENVTNVEKIFKKARGVKTDERYFQEFVVFSTNLVHYFTRIPSKPGTVFAVVCQGDANVGLILVKAREIARALKF